VPATFVNVLEAPDGGLVVFARLGHAHARVAAIKTVAPRTGTDAERLSSDDEDV
jgi:hypothetical protein